MTEPGDAAGGLADPVTTGNTSGSGSGGIDTEALSDAIVARVLEHLRGRGDAPTAQQQPNNPETPAGGSVGGVGAVGVSVV